MGKILYNDNVKRFVTPERLMLAFFVGGSFIGIWHALPMLTVIADEQYYVGGVLRALEAGTVLPPLGDVPYGTLTFYLNYIIQVPLLLLLFAWKGFHILALKEFLIFHPEVSYIVPRLLSAVLASITAVAYDRFLRAEGVPLPHRFAALAALFFTILPAVVFHTGKMWVLSTVLVFASFLFLYRALQLRGTDPHKAAQSGFWSICVDFLAFANFPLAGVFLVSNILVLAYVFRMDRKRMYTLGRGVLVGGGVLLAVLIINHQNIYYQVADIFTNYHPLVTGEDLVTPPLSASFFFHIKQVAVAFPALLMLLLFAISVRAIQNKLLFWLSACYASLYVVTLVFLVTWYSSVGELLRYVFPLGFFFSTMIAALEYKKMRGALWAFCAVQVPLYLYVLYLLSVPTTFNLASNYIFEHYRGERVLIYNDVVELTLPQNKQSALLMEDKFCGSKCRYVRTASTAEDFMPVVVTFQSELSKVDGGDFSSILWVSGRALEGSCAGISVQAGVPVASFQSGASDENYLSIEHNLGNYLVSDFWYLSRLGKNIYIYKVSEQCWRASL